MHAKAPSAANSDLLVNLLVRIMEEEGVSQCELARRMGVEQPCVSKRLSHPENIKLKDFGEMLGVLGCELNVTIIHGLFNHNIKWVQNARP